MIELIKEAWSEEAAQGLGKALGEDLPDVAGEIEAGRDELWRVIGYGWAVTRLEQRSYGDVLILKAGQRIDGGKFKYMDAVKAFCNLAANIGAARVITSTQHSGIGRMIEKLGFCEVERKYEINIKGLSGG